MKGRNGDEKWQARNMDALPPAGLMGLWEEVYSCVKPPRRETSNIHEMDISTNIFAKYETGSPSTVDLELSGKNYHHHQKPKDRQFLFFFFFLFANNRFIPSQSGGWKSDGEAVGGQAASGSGELCPLCSSWPSGVADRAPHPGHAYLCSSLSRLTRGPVIGCGPSPAASVTLSELNYVCKDPVSKEGHIHRGTSGPQCTFGGPAGSQGTQFKPPGECRELAYPVLCSNH